MDPTQYIEQWSLQFSSDVFYTQNLSRTFSQPSINLFMFLLIVIRTKNSVNMSLKYKLFKVDPTQPTNKKLSYRRGTARCVVSFEILPTALQQCSTTSPEHIEVMKLEG